MSNLLQLWREVCERSPALVNPQGKHLIVNESDCMLLGCEIERACLPPAPPSVVETLGQPDLKTVTFDASHRALIERAAKIIQAGADSLKEAHCLNGDWRDSDLARRDYYDELAVVGQLCAMLASSQSADHSGEATEKVDHVADVRNMVAAQSAGQEALFWYRPCADGLYEGPYHANSELGKMLRAEKPEAWKPLFTEQRTTGAANVPDDEGWEWVRVKNLQPLLDALERAERKGYLPDAFESEWEALEIDHAAPVNGGERDTVEVAIALEQQRTLAIVKAVRDINFGESPTGMPTPASAAYDLACEEIERRVRTEQWELDGAAAPLPSAERAADARQAAATNARLLRALEEIVKNDPFNQSSAGVIARAALTSPTKTGDLPTLEALELFAANLAKDGRLTWAGFRKDSDDRHTIPIISPATYKLVCAAIAEWASPAKEQK